MATRLNLRIHSVKCVDETGGYWAEKVGNDEIDLGGFTIDNENNTVKIKSTSVGYNFDDGEINRFNPPRVFASFDLGPSFSTTKKFAAGFVLSERDGGNVSGTLEKIVNKLKEYLEQKKTAMVEARAANNKAASVAVAWLWPYVKAYVISYVLSNYKGWVGDDVFPLQEVSTSLYGSNHSWNGSATSPIEIVEFRAHDGVYQVHYSWELV